MPTFNTPKGSFSSDSVISGGNSITTEDISDGKVITVPVNLEKLLQQSERRDVSTSNRDTSLVSSAVASHKRAFKYNLKVPLPIPDFKIIRILKDTRRVPFVRLHWTFSIVNAKTYNVRGFIVYRRRLPKNEISSALLKSYSKDAFERVSRGLVKTGKFGYDRKGLNLFRKSSIPKSILNSNLFNVFKTSGVRDSIVNIGSKGYNFNKNTRFVSERDFGGKPTRIRASLYKSKRPFVKVGFVRFDQATKKVFSKLFQDKLNRGFVFDDKAVAYNEVYEYYIEAVSRNEISHQKSINLRVRVTDYTKVAAPQYVRLFQYDEKTIIVSVKARKKDDIGEFLIYKKSQNDLGYKFVAVLKNRDDDYIKFVDKAIEYGQVYNYRVFAKSIYGRISEPKEAQVSSVVQRVTASSRSNTLKIPIISAEQDQNSDFIRVTISSNDSRILYYELDRKDLTIKERSFSVPKKMFGGELPTNKPTYGGEGWSQNSFFVQKEFKQLQPSNTLEGLFNVKLETKEIVFIDKTISFNHLYQYRVRGYDSFENASSYAFSTVKASGKKSVREPINFNFDILSFSSKYSPFKIRLSWNDDNKEGLENVSFVLQRRKEGENIYKSFPETKNNFIIDETSFSKVSVQGQNIKKLERASFLPSFLDFNSVYYYRVYALSKQNNKTIVSNYTNEIRVITHGELSKPLDFRVNIANVRVRPLIAKITWLTDKAKIKPDRWLVEKKVDEPNSVFEVVGRAYVNSRFFDDNVRVGNTYIYRIRAEDLLGRFSEYEETRITI